MWTKPGRAEAGRFTVTNSDGALVNADAGCSGAVFFDGVSDSSTVTIVSDALGKYKWSLTVSDVAIPGTRAEVLITTTVNSINTADSFLIGRVVPSDVWDSVMSDTDRFDVNVTHVSDVAQATAGDIVSDSIGAWAAAVALVIATSDAIADAVWDEAQADHVVAGGMGRQISDVLLDTADLQGNQAAWATATGFSTHVPSDVASDVWNSLQASHVVAGSFGLVASDVLLDTDDLQTNQAAWATTTMTSDAIADAIWDEDLASGQHATADTAGKYVSDIKDAGGATSADIASDVWNSLQASHVLADTFGKQISDIKLAGGATSAEIASDVWNSLQVSHVVAGSFGQVVSDILLDTDDLQGNQAAWATATGFSTHVPSDVASDVWNSLQAAHVAAGSMGKIASDTLLDTDDLQTNQAAWATATGFSTHVPSDVASDVWNSLQASHVAAGSFGKVASDILLDTGDLQTNQGNWITTTMTSDAIADAVWDEDLSSGQHATANTAGKYLSDVKDAGGATSAQIASDVWNSLQVSHVAAGSFGLQISDIKLAGGATSAEIASDVWNSLQVAHVAAGSFGQIVSDVLLDTNDLQTNQGSWATTTMTSDAIADAVWDEGVGSGNHAGANTAGKYLSDIMDDTADLQTNQGAWATATGFSIHVPSDVASDVWNSLQASHVVSGSFGKVASDVLAEVDGLNGATPPTSAAIASDVWNSLQAAHVVVGSFGKVASDVLLDTADLQTNQGAWATATGFSTHVPSDVASDVWNSLKAAHTTTDTFGAYLNSDIQTAIDAGGGSAPTAAAIADAVWDEAQADHVVAGGMGKQISDTLLDTADLQGNQAAWATATGFSTHVPSDVAHSVLKTSVSDTEGTAAEHSLTYTVLLGSESTRSGTTLTVKKTDGTTFKAKTITSDSSATPVTGIT